MMYGRGFFRAMTNDETQKPKVTRELIMRVLSYARPYWGHIAVTLVLILATTGLNLINPLIFRELIDNALQPPGDPGLVNLLALALVTIPIVNAVLRVWQRRVNASIGEGVIYDLRVALFRHLQRMSLRFFTNTKTGELMSRMNNDVVGAQNAISSTFVNIVTNFITVVATLGVMLTLEWRLTILGIVIFPAFYFIAQRIGTRIRDIARRQMEYNAQMNALMNETLNISGTLLVKLFGRTDEEVGRFDERAAQVRDEGIERAVVGVQLFVMLSLVGVIGTALVYWAGGHLVLAGEFTVGTIVAFSAYLTQLYGPLQALTTAPVDFATSMVSFERVFEITDLPIEIDERPAAIKLTDVRGELAFKNVSFSYAIDESALLTEVTRYGHIDNVKATLSGDAASEDKKGQANGADNDGANDGDKRSRRLLWRNGNRNGDATPDAEDKASPAKRQYSQAREKALNNVSFHIQPGQLAALVGPSGAGKTTMTYLIPRLYDPTEGSIHLDGYDLRDLTLDSLSDNIGMVTQETYLFHDTIRTNLLYARPDATQADIEAACIAANIHDFIADLPDGYDTVVGERGYRLSGGEKQRIAIARVILKDPRLLVLDEATSNLDSQSEALIQDALSKVQKGRTSIVIAHRLSTILAADRIFVMDKGQVVEQGTHDELIAMNGLYTSLYTTQFSREPDMM